MSTNGACLSMNWIKMRSGLHESPKVLAIAEDLQKPVLHVVGMLWRIWSWADQHSLDGQNLTVSLAAIDRLTDCPGLAECIRKVGWLEGRDGLLTFPRFAEHNGQTAKQRALDQVRKRTDRGLSGICPDSSRTESGPEKIREEKIRRTSLSPTPEAQKAFDAFWLAYPRKVAKPKALASFLREGCVENLTAILAAVEAQKKSPQWLKDNGEYIPHPTTWLNQHRWEDETTMKPKFGVDPC